MTPVRLEAAGRRQLALFGHQVGSHDYKREPACLGFDIQDAPEGVPEDAPEDALGDVHEVETSIEATPEAEFYCAQCGLDFNGAEHYARHMAGKYHMAWKDHMDLMHARLAYWQNAQQQQQQQQQPLWTDRSSMTDR